LCILKCIESGGEALGIDASAGILALFKPGEAGTDAGESGG